MTGCSIIVTIRQFDYYLRLFDCYRLFLYDGLFDYRYTHAA